MTTYNEYYNEIRTDIAKEFGLEFGGFAPSPRPALSVNQALYLNAKYQSDPLALEPNQKAVEIARRYGSLVKMWRNSQTR